MIVRIIEYSDLFPEEKHIPNIKSLISHINRGHLISLVINMMNKLSEKPFYNPKCKTSKSDDVDYLRFFISEENTLFLEEVLQRYNHFEKRIKASGYGGPILATRPAAILLLLRYIFSVQPCKDNFIPQMEIDYFKALLLANQEVNNAVMPEFNENTNSSLQLAQILIAYSYSNVGIENNNYNDIYRRQIIRFCEFYRFLTYSKHSKPLRREFCNEYHIKNIASYLVPHVFSLNGTGLKCGIIGLKNRKGLMGIAHKVMCKSSIGVNEFIPFDKNVDYSLFRAKPFIRINKNEFAIISIPFVLEHISESLYFELKKHRNVVNYPDDDSFRNFITTNFTQNWMLNRFMEMCKSPIQTISLNDTKCNDIIGKKYLVNVHPLDYYIREGNNVILFELKSTLACAKTKEKRNLESFLSDLRDRFLESNHKQPKAIKQLMANAKTIQEGGFVFDSCVDKHTTIYPVIIVDSTYYTMTGIRVQLESWMREHCRIENINDSMVKPIILMDIATIGLYNSLFRKKGFVTIFEEYYAYIHSGNNMIKNILNEHISFSEYLSRQPIENVKSTFDNVIKGVIKQVIN